MMKINSAKKLSLLSFFSFILCSSIVGIPLSAQAEEYYSDICNESSNSTYPTNSEQISIRQRPYTTHAKIYFPLFGQRVYKITCSIDKGNSSIRKFTLAIPDTSDLSKLRVTVIENGILIGSRIIGRGQSLSLNIHPKNTKDYTVIYEAIEGDGSLYFVSRDD
jgi:hypothetical protein